MQTLSESQLKAAALLGDGMSKTDVALSMGCHVRTITRYLDVAEFVKEVEARRALAAAGERLNEARQISPTGFDLPAVLASLRASKRDTRLQVRECGSSILSKCCERLSDLPIEALTPQLLPQYFKVGKELLEWADEQEAQELEISELVEQMLGPDSLVGQKVQVETSANLERIYQTITDSPEFSASQKETIFKTIAGTHTHVPDSA
jgi:hypothetical protein